MYVVFNREALITAISKVIPARSKRTPKPELESIKVVAKDGVATVYAHDLTQSASYVVAGADVKEEGSCLLTKAAIDGLRLLPAEFVPVKAVGTGVVYDVPKARMSFASEDPAVYPAMMLAAGDPAKLDAGKFTESLKMVLGAADQTPNKHSAPCVAIDSISGVLTLAAAKTSVLSSSQVDGHDPLGERWMLPLPAAQVVAKFDPDEGGMFVSHDENLATFRVGRLTYTHKLGPQVFPNWQAVLPNDDQQYFKADAGKLLGCLRMAGVTTAAESLSVTISVSGSCLTVASRGAEVGESSVQMDLHQDAGDFEIKVNPDSMIGRLQECRSDLVWIGVRQAANSMALIVKDGGFVSLVSGIVK